MSSHDEGGFMGSGEMKIMEDYVSSPQVSEKQQIQRGGGGGGGGARLRRHTVSVVDADGLREMSGEGFV